jgi:hypothetical protein
VTSPEPTLSIDKEGRIRTGPGEDDYIVGQTPFFDIGLIHPSGEAIARAYDGIWLLTWTPGYASETFTLRKIWAR